MLFKSIRCSALLLGMALAVQVQAGIVLNTTRIVYPAKDKEVSFVVQNNGVGEILAQSWLEPDGESAGVGDLPFIITPALAPMAGNARQLLRIIYAGAGMPDDRESVLWLNVQEIPQTAQENQLQIAIRQRIKVFFRPEGLDGDPLKAAAGLQWQVVAGQLEVSNPGPYHVSMIKLTARQHDKLLLEADGRMLAPLQRLQLPFKQAASGAPVELSFTSINDFGAQEPYQAQVFSGRTTQASKYEPRPD